MMKFQVKVGGRVLRFENGSDEMTIEDVYSMDVSPEQDATIRDMMDRIQLQGSGGEIRGGIEVHRIRRAVNAWPYHRSDRAGRYFIQGPQGEIIGKPASKKAADKLCDRLNGRLPNGGRIYPPIPE